MAILVIDIGNTNTHLGLATERRVRKRADLPTARAACEGSWVRRFLGGERVDGAMIASVVPQASRRVGRWVRRYAGVHPRWLTADLDLGMRIRYPQPRRLGADRLANAVGLVALHGVPGVVVDFGTAVTFDVVNARREYVGGVIAPGLAAMTGYLHERTALLPTIRIREPRSAIGKSTVEAMRVGAVHGHRGLVREILAEIRRELGVRRLRVVATGGYAALIARHVPEIQQVSPALTLEGLRIVFFRNERGAR